MLQILPVVIGGLLAIVGAVSAALVTRMKEDEGKKFGRMVLAFVAILLGLIFFGWGIYLVVPRSSSTPGATTTTAQGSVSAVQNNPGSNRYTIVSTSCAHLRREPNTESPQIGCLAPGTLIHIECTRKTGEPQYGPFGKSYIWDRVDAGGKTGYVSDANVQTGSSNAVAPTC